MKTENQRKSQIKRLITTGTSSLTWINFLAETKDGKKYISGHNAYGKSITLCSDGNIFEGVKYHTGYLIIGDLKSRIVQLSEIQAIDNNDLSKPALSGNVRQMIEDFEINFK